jgi:hypothetical protein
MYLPLLWRAGRAMPLLSLALLGFAAPASAQDPAPVAVGRCEVWTAPDARESATVEIAFANQRPLPASAIDLVVAWDGDRTQTFHEAGRFAQNVIVVRRYEGTTWTHLYERPSESANCRVTRVRYADGAVWP